MSSSEPEGLASNDGVTYENYTAGAGQSTAQPSASDAQAIARYKYLLATANPEDIERAHEEAFEQLTPQQRQEVLQQLSATSGENVASASPADLARAATRAEVRNPGYLESTLGSVATRSFGTSMLGGIAGLMLGTTLMRSLSGIGHLFGLGWMHPHRHGFLDAVLGGGMAPPGPMPGGFGDGLFGGHVGLGGFGGFGGFGGGPGGFGGGPGGFGGPGGH